MFRDKRIEVESNRDGYLIVSRDRLISKRINAITQTYPVKLFTSDDEPMFKVSVNEMTQILPTLPVPLAKVLSSKIGEKKALSSNIEGLA